MVSFFVCVTVLVLNVTLALPPPAVDGVSEPVPVEPIVIADGDGDDVILPNGIATEVSRTLNDVSLVVFAFFFK